jgi:hypothetical protein
MAHREKNLLEAFSASAAVEKATSSEQDEAAAGGPFAESPPSPPQLEVDDGEKLGIAETLLQPENRGGLLILAGLGLTLAFLGGRASKGEVVAAGESEPKGGEETSQASALPNVIPVAPAAGTTSDPAPEPELSSAEQALVDPINRFTIKLVEYAVDQDEDFAWANLHYLEDLGLPVAMLQRGKRLFIVIGAEAKQANLDDLLQQAKSMAGPPPRNKPAEFSDAYVVMIDSVLDR